MRGRHIRIIIILIFLLFGACGKGHNSDFNNVRRSHLDSISFTLSNYNAEGKYDSLVIVARGFLKRGEERQDTLSILYSGVYIAQAFLFMEDADSVKYYLEMIEPFQAGNNDPKLGVTLNNVLGINAMKTELNYSRALEYFQKGYEWAKKEEYSKSINHRISLLINIVNIFYIRSDKHGMEYAKEAYALIQEENVGGYYRCSALLGMAQMTFLSGDYGESYGYIQQVERIAQEAGYYSLVPLINLIYADLYNIRREYSSAENYYLRALNNSELSDPGTASLIYLHYGKFCEDRQQYSKAISLYKQGLDASFMHLEFRRSLLRRLSDLYYLAGEREVSLEYYREYRAHLEEVENTQREQEFNNQLLSYQQVAHEHELQTKELALLRANRRIIIFVFILLIFLLISGSFIWLYNRQLKMYRTLVTQHQSFMQRLNRASLADESVENLPEKTGGGKELFQKVEQLMREEKFYRLKDISLEKVADYLNSNKTYVSKAINTFVGISFNSYINMYRIGEATNIIANPDNETPLKKIADDLGYNSVSVFYKAFQRETGCTPGRYRKEIEESRGKDL